MKITLSQETKEQLIGELTTISQNNNGQLPRGTMHHLAKKYNTSDITVKRYAETLSPYARTNNNPSINEKIDEEDISLTAVKQTLYRLEGAIQGIAPFHPRLAQYMLTQVNFLLRYFYIKQHQYDPKDLSMKSKIGWEDIDKEILRDSIADNKIMNGIKKEH